MTEANQQKVLRHRSVLVKACVLSQETHPMFRLVEEKEPEAMINTALKQKSN